MEKIYTNNKIKLSNFAEKKIEMIPKIIHYCWFGTKKMSKTDRQCIKSWKKHLPDYKLMLWNEQNSPIEAQFVKEA